jgi:hypothetical protein
MFTELSSVRIPRGSGWCASQSVAAKNARQFTGLFSWMDPSLNQQPEIYSEVCEAGEQGT